MIRLASAACRETMVYSAASTIICHAPRRERRAVETKSPGGAFHRGRGYGGTELFDTALQQPVHRDDRNSQRDRFEAVRRETDPTTKPPVQDQAARSRTLHKKSANPGPTTTPVAWKKGAPMSC